MALESERKYGVDDLRAVRRLLETKEQAILLGEYFESNRIFDWPDRALLQQRKLLRLRQGGRTVLCLKSPPAGEHPEDLKVWQENQTEVGSVHETAAVLGQLGLRVVLEYEKIRSKWRWGACEVCLDRVPFGRFVEIEGDEPELTQVAAALELDPRRATTATYHELNPAAGTKDSPERYISFVFSEPERSALRQSCQNGNVESCL